MDAMTTATFDSLSPLDGTVVRTFPVHDADDVATSVARARRAARDWRSLGFAGRRRALAAWRRDIVAHLDDLIAVVRAETGKPAGDARLEIMLALDHLAWAASHARRVLRWRAVFPGPLMLNQSASLGYVPYGVIGVIGPWNYPVFTPMGSLAYALAAGNAVVFKPSEYTPAVGTWLRDSFVRAGGPAGVFEVVTGLGATGAALCRAGVDKVAFTGSTATGKAVMAACAESLTPVVIEAGGKDALLVDEDADLDAAAEAAVWGAYSNAGQTCIGIERVYAHTRVYDRFVEKVAERTAELRAGVDDAARLGPMTMPRQGDVVRAHVADALAHGGTLRVGTAPGGGSTLQPVLLVGVGEESTAVREETFGPTLVVNRVASMEEAVDRANAVRYGLSGSVFSRRRGRELAARLRGGMVAINSVIAFAAVPALPFGGVGDSGFGRIHGADGLREFAYARAITRQRFPLLTLTTMRRTPGVDRIVERIIRALYG
ncbi:MAG: aldehyde dehydrogenase [Microbacterium sp. 71-36]|uniref:aldehyde dehydrogenase family protein n=2 Tax=Microbacterium TaxID=33882 RepID=UPI00086F4235|nr:aldehyde dehydrogenase family protein [Microbacterium sp. 71-36]ODT36544.1 MAG: aldehyde dehydrogenase [Microbacterium sp. SCN 71-17]OJV74432.1 MAG: aldehyde dehydrogenase [Microbacterium sp. 71-36]